MFFGGVLFVIIFWMVLMDLFVSVLFMLLVR